MSVSPYVKFNFQNNNVMETTPLMGVSCILARTTQGPFKDPSKVITSYAQFQREFGEEEMADGTVSNIQKALELGSKLRIIRVLAGEDEPGSVDKPSIATIGGVEFKIKPKIIANEDDKYTLKITALTNGTTGYDYTITRKVDGSIVESGALIRYKEANDKGNAVVDYNSFSSFITNSTIIEPESMDVFNNAIKYLKSLDGTAATSLGIAVTAGESVITPNHEGAEAEPSKEDYIGAIDCLLDYTDVYQIAVSNLPAYFTTDSDIYEIYAGIAEKIVPLQEYTLYVEVPKTKKTVSEITTWTKAAIGAIGQSKYVAYFAGGIKYYNDMGTLINCDCIGTILGLGDASASNYGPWKSFAGMNRGVIWDGNGPVCPNYGSPSQYDNLNELAQNYVNMIVVKDTASSGKQTMLWHLFTSQVKQDSERFLSIVRLNLYLKKTLRPILENYLEEPNTWGTWKNIWLRVKPILDNLVDQQAMTEYTWMGDQNATSYNDLTVNNEADVRQGKYKVVLKYKDVVPMQEITVNITIDAASQTVNINSGNE